MFWWNWSISLCLLAFNWSSTTGWRWKTEDAIIQDVWPDETISAKFKRSLASSPSPVTVATTPSAVDLDEDESVLVFEGRYFKPNEVPPPPAFMLANSNWRGGVTSKLKHSKQPQSKKSSSFYYVATVGTGSRLPPLSQKFTAENAKELNDNGTDKNAKSSSTAVEERISSSNSKNVITASSLELDDLPYTEEHSLSEDLYQNAPKCFTANDSQGRCIPFRQCYPVVFNVIDGALRNPGLGKLLYQSSGPCNATLELDFALNKMKSDKTFLNANFYNQSICCPGFKHPPAVLQTWEEDVRSTRLTSSVSQKLSSKLAPSKTVNTSREQTPMDDLDEYTFSISGTDNQSSDHPLGIEESSVEISHNANSDEVEIERGDVDVTVAGDDTSEDENIRMAIVTDIVKENATLEVGRDDTDEDTATAEERRGDRDKGSHLKKPADAFLSIPAPNLSPNRCRHQIYGMPRGHWPWMVALVISSRHICSGALIDERHVLTASHCVYLLEEEDVKKLRIIIGDRVMYSAVDGPHFWRKAAKIITHVHYNQQTFASDIAIIRMNSNVPFSRNVQPISLSDLESPVDSTIFQRGIVAGWSGADIGQPSFEARTEMEAVVDIIDKEQCKDEYSGFALSGVPPNTFCTRAANSTCVADSGAPLVVRAHNCWVLAGIMSWGLGCSFPEVYTDITRYTTWIRKHLA